jgi:hypothetical protein
MQWLPVGMTKNGLDDWQSKLIKLGSVFSALLGFKRVAIWRCTGVQVQQYATQQHHTTSSCSLSCSQSAWSLYKCPSSNCLSVACVLRFDQAQTCFGCLHLIDADCVRMRLSCGRTGW